ncbi:MAG: DMT family transporter [Chloroflexi bacterium]|nr:DMT family transporter [Chloroflexota bacterium]
MKNDTSLGLTAVVISSLAFGMLPIFTKFAYQGDLVPLDILTWRFVFGAGAIWLTWPIWRRWVDLRELTSKQILWRLGLGAVYIFPALIGVLGLERVEATFYMLLFFTFPAMVALTNRVLGERMPGMSWVAIGLALTGSALIIGVNLTVRGPLDILLPLLNAAGYAVYLVIVGRFFSDAPGLATGALSVSGTLLVLIPLLLFRGVGIPSSFAGWWPVMGLGVVSTMLALMMMLVAVSLLGASRAAVMSTLELVFSLAFAALLLGEHIGPTQLIGGGLIFVSVILLQLPRREAQPTPVSVAEPGTD